jgi:hypothetical protein
VTASSRQELAFEAYLAMGPGRSLAKLADTIGKAPASYGFTTPPSLRTLQSWSADYGWQWQIVDVDGRAREEARKQHLRWAKEHRERLHECGLLLQNRGVEGLSEKRGEAMKLSDAIAAINTGLKLEALAFAEPTQRIALDDESLRRLTDSELDSLIGLLQKAQGLPPKAPRRPDYGRFDFP